MFFSKRREKKAQELKDGQLKEENWFSAGIKDAMQIEDPAVRVSTLQKIKGEIDGNLAEKAKVLSQKISKSQKRFGFVYGIGDVATVGGLCAAGTGPIAWTVAGSGAAVSIGATVTGRIRQDSIKKKYRKENGEHVDHLNEINARVDKAIKETLEENVEAIVHSPHFLSLNGRILPDVVKIPGLAERFNTAIKKRGEEIRLELKPYLDKAIADADAENKAAAAKEAEKPTLKRERPKIVFRKREPKA